MIRFCSFDGLSALPWVLRTIPTPADYERSWRLAAAGLCCSTIRSARLPSVMVVTVLGLCPLSGAVQHRVICRCIADAEPSLCTLHRILSDSGNQNGPMVWKSRLSKLKAQALRSRADRLRAWWRSSACFGLCFGAGRRGRESPGRPDSIDSTPINVYIYIYRAKKLQGLWRKLDGSTLASWTSARTAARRILWLLDVTPGNLRARARAITHDIPS